MPVDGTRREDGFIWGGSKWRSPEGFAAYRKSQQRYNQNRYLYTSNHKSSPGNAGESGEFLVAHDLLYRGLQVTKALNRNCPDDLHVKASNEWYTIQVKLGKVNKTTGRLSPNNGGRRISSDILAIVDLAGKRIRYIARGKPVPRELLDE